MTIIELLNCILLAIGFLGIIAFMTIYFLTTPEEPKGGAVWGTKEK